MDYNEKIFIAGHRGLVGSALKQKLNALGHTNIVTRSRKELDLLDYKAVKDFFVSERPDYVFLAAAKQGGIYANDTYRADFIYENISLQTNILYLSFQYEVKRLMYYACSCIYPKDCPQPMKEQSILSGALEQTNEPFAVAKIAGLKMSESFNRQYGTDFISVIPTNIYGPKQSYEPMNCLVIPALIKNIHDAKLKKKKEVVIWGTGKPSRDFLFVDDLVDASIFLMFDYDGNDCFNIATGVDHSIAELAEIIKKEIGFEGNIRYDESYPDGVIRKVSDVTKINKLGWTSKISLEEGIQKTYQSFLQRKF